MSTWFDELPLFPLPRVVLMPGSVLPLHVFEPRYRSLVDHCVGGDGLVGIATLRPDGSADPAVPPAVYPEVGVGRIAAVDRLPDGRCNILVEHVAAGWIVDELPSDEPFRIVRAERVDPSEADPTGEVAALRTLLAQLGVLGEGPAFSVDDRALVDALAVRLLEDTELRRAYLAARTLGERARLVAGEIAALAIRDVPVGEA